MAKTPGSLLNELMQQLKVEVPKYTELCTEFLGTPNLRFRFQVSALGYEIQGLGPSKQAAKHDAASKLLNVLQAEGRYVPKMEGSPTHSTGTSTPNGLMYSSPTSQEMNNLYLPVDTQMSSALASPNNSPASSSNDSPSLNDSLMSIQSISNEPANAVIIENSANHLGVCQLNEYCLQHFLPDPVYEMVDRSGPSHMPIFKFQCKVLGNVTEATATSIKRAKREVAMRMLDILKGDREKQLSEMLGKGKEDWMSHFDPEDIKDKYMKLSSLHINKNRGEKYVHSWMYMITDIMEKKDITAYDLWKEIKLPISHRDTEQLDEVLQKLELQYNIEYQPLEDGFVGFLMLDTKPPTSVSALGDTELEVKDGLLNNLVQFLQGMSM